MGSQRLRAPIRRTAERPKAKPARHPERAPVPRGAPRTAAQAITLQAIIGNRAVGRLVQAKLKVGAARDPFEREADAVADRVIDAGSNGERVSRSAEGAPAYDPLGGTTVDREQETAINQPGGGSPLPDGVRSQMESAFGQDLGAVRVHHGRRAEELSRSMQATAFTTGHNIFFGKGAYQPGTRAGQHLLAHELTHVVQQGGARRVSRQACSEVIQRSNIRWGTATAAKPSTSGVKGGVFFVTVGGTTHVVKATEDVGATKFAENLMTMLGANAIESPDSEPIARATPEFAAIMQALNQLVPAAPQQNAANYARDQAAYTAYTTKLAAFANAPYLLIQKNLKTAGSFVLGNQYVSKELEAAGPGAATQQAARTHAQEQAQLLMDGHLMRAVGRTLAIDTATGNADRFEQMNTQNAFLRADHTIGAIDTEAVMQSLAGMKQFASTDTGRRFVPEGKTDIDRYVDFVIGHATTGGGTKIEDAGAGSTPSASARRMMNDFDSWFKKTFFLSFMDQEATLDAEMTRLGFPADVTKGFWPIVGQQIRAGFDAGVADVQASATGANRARMKADFQGLSADYDEGDNFAWDAFRMRTEYMGMIKDGATHKEARSYIVDRLTLREKSKDNQLLSTKTLRVIGFGKIHNILDAKQERRIRKTVVQMTPKDLKDVLHVSELGKKKLLESKTRDETSVAARNNRLEAARAHQLLNLATNVGTSDLPTAVATGKADAKRLLKADVDQLSYFTKDGRNKARGALASIGVDIKKWGPA